MATTAGVNKVALEVALEDDAVRAAAAPAVGVAACGARAAVEDGGLIISRS